MKEVQLVIEHEDKLTGDDLNSLFTFNDNNINKAIFSNPVLAVKAISTNTLRERKEDYEQFLPAARNSVSTKHANFANDVKTSSSSCNPLIAAVMQQRQKMKEKSASHGDAQTKPAKPTQTNLLPQIMNNKLFLKQHLLTNPEKLALLIFESSPDIYQRVLAEI